MTNYVKLIPCIIHSIYITMTSCVFIRYVADIRSGNSLFKSQTKYQSLFDRLKEEIRFGRTERFTFATVDKILTDSNRNSMIYLFTNSLPSDLYHLGHIQNKITRKDLQVFFFFNYAHQSSSSRGLDKKNNEVESCTSESLELETYNKISAATGGQIFYFNESDASNLESFTSYASTTPKTMIFFVCDCLFGTVEFNVPLDSLLDQAIISISGSRVQVTATLPNG